MKRASAAGLFALVVALITLAAGLSLRTASTTINYPAYSSLNNEEQGLRALYETARRLGTPVERSYQSFAKTVGTKGTLLYACRNVESLRQQTTKELELYERVAKPGARLVFLIGQAEEDFVSAEAPSSRKASKGESKPGGAKPPGSKPESENLPPGLKGSGSPKPEEKKYGGLAPKQPEDNLKTRWGVEMKSLDTANPEKFGNRANRVLSGGGMWVTRRWSFSKWDDQWKPVADSEGQVYQLERSFGAGSVALQLGLEALTNKTLLTKVDSARITGLLSGPRPLIFEEAHLGVADDDTVAGYARERHLEWLLLGLAILAGLYVWRSSVSFVPALPEIKGVEVAGREAHSALTSLLSRSIKRTDLPREIIAAWRESCRMLLSSAVRVAEESLEAFGAADDSDAPAGYVAVSRLANGRRPTP